MDSKRYIFCFLQGLAATPSRPGYVSSEGGHDLPSSEVWLSSFLTLF